MNTGWELSFRGRQHWHERELVTKHWPNRSPARLLSPATGDRRPAPSLELGVSAGAFRLALVGAALLLISAAAIAASGGGGDPPPPPPAPPADELPIIDTRNAEFLDEAAAEPRASGAAFSQGDAIDLWNGNLRLSHPSSPSYALAGRLSLGLARGYNSKKARKDRLVFGALLRQTVMGRSWVGLGWTSHFGRIFKMPVYRGDGDYGERSYFETPTGGLFKFKPNLNKAHPGLNIQYVADPTCTNWGPKPVCSKFPDSPECNEDICRDWNEKPGYYEVTYPDGTVVKLDHYVAAEVLNPGNWIENYDLAGWYAKEITDVSGNKIHIEYSADPAAVPGAIEKVWAGTDANNPDAQLTMTLWSQADVDAGDCPAAAKGHLRSVHGTGFEGLEVAREFDYEMKTLVDQQRGELREAGQQKVLDVAILTRVDVGEPGAAPALTTLYSYGVSPSVGSSSAPFSGSSPYGTLNVDFPQAGSGAGAYGMFGVSGGSRSLPFLGELNVVSLCDLLE